MTISLWHICDVFLCRFGRVFGIMVAVAAVGCLIYLLGLVYLRVIEKPGVGFGDRMIRSNFTRYKKVTMCDIKGDFTGCDKVSGELFCFYKFWLERCYVEVKSLVWKQNLNIKYNLFREFWANQCHTSLKQQQPPNSDNLSAMTIMMRPKNYIT